MKIAYHFVVPRPPSLETDGAVQEALCLEKRFGGSLHFSYPRSRFHRLVSPSLSGLRQVAELRKLDGQVDLHHVFLDRVRPLLLPRYFSKPWIGTVLTSRKAGARPGLPRSLRSASTLVAPSIRDATALELPDGPRVEVVPSGIDVEHFSLPGPPTTGRFHLLVGSAPWTRRQFRSKGLLQLLDAAAAIPELELTFLWRSGHREAADREAANRGVAERVRIIDRVVDVREVLETVHAVAALAERSHLLKSYPHSLLESLAAGRPVMVSSGLALASLVSTARCGTVVDSLSAENVRAAVLEMIDDYSDLRRNAADLDLGPFSREKFLSNYEIIYRRTLRR